MLAEMSQGPTEKHVAGCHSRALALVETAAPLVAPKVASLLDEALAEVSVLELNADVLAELDDDRFSTATGGVA